MEVKEFQLRCVELLKKWEKKRGVNPSAQDELVHVVEEIGELAREYVSRRERKERYSRKELENAFGDVMIHLLRLADMEGLDMEQVVAAIIKNEAPKD